MKKVRRLLESNLGLVCHEATPEPLDLCKGPMLLVIIAPSLKH